MSLDLATTFVVVEPNLSVVPVAVTETIFDELDRRFAGFKGRSDQGVLYTPFERCLAESDILTLHCPLTPVTRNMFASVLLAATDPNVITTPGASDGIQPSFAFRDEVPFASLKTVATWHETEQMLDDPYATTS